MHALVMKELRTLRGIAVLGLLGFGAVLWRGIRAMSPPTYGMPESAFEHWGIADSLANELPNWFLLCAICLSSMLGLVSGAADNARRTWQFVLFRPISRQRYVLVKFVTGWLLTVSIVLGFVLVAMGYESRPGVRAAPFDAWQFQPMWECTGVAAGLFSAAFLSSVRTAAWWWSKLWPLMGAGIGLWWCWMRNVIGGMAPMMPNDLGFWLICLVMSIACAVTSVRMVEERDFT